MQFNFNINEILKNPVEVVDKSCNLDYYCSNVDANSVKSLQAAQQLSYAVDAMGDASKLAQNLPKVVTTSAKLRSSDHRVYLSKDESANDGRGELVGLLKVGLKRLFVHDAHGCQRETVPLCVLDFYVHESRQRRGFGKALFDAMLQAENVEPHQLAIDRPSPKLLSFLAKHYQLKEPILQSNNFVVFMKFFSSAPMAATNSRYNRSALSSSAATAPSPQNQQQQRLLANQPTAQLRHVTAHGLATDQPISHPNKPMTAAPSSLRSRPLSSVSKDKINLELERKSPTKMGIPVCPEPPMMPRGDNWKQQCRWYLDPANINLTTAPRQGPFNKVPNQVFPQIKSSSPDKMYACHSAARRSPSIGCDISQPIAVHSNPQARRRADYNYSVGLARNYSHNRIW